MAGPRGLLLLDTHKADSRSAAFYATDPRVLVVRSRLQYTSVIAVICTLAAGGGRKFDDDPIAALTEGQLPGDGAQRRRGREVDFLARRAGSSDQRVYL